MRITTKITFNMLTGEVLDHEFYDYEGPIAKCDRQLKKQATANAAEAGTAAGGYGSSATNENAELTPVLTQELKAKHGFDPSQINELLTAAGAGAGGATSALAGDAGLEAARTRNASGFTKSLDEVARDRAKAAAGSSEGIAAQDVMGAKALNQEGAAGLQGLYGTNVNAQLKAMGQQNEDTNTALEAGKSGWLQNMTGVINSLSGAAQAASGMKTAFK